MLTTERLPSQDFFYICPSHLTDRNFCSPIIDAAEVEAKAKRDAMAKEIEKVKKEYEERQARKAKKSGDKDKDKEKEKEKDKDGEDKDDKTAENERDDKVGFSTLQSVRWRKRIMGNWGGWAVWLIGNALQIDAIKKSGDTTTPSTDDSPRIFALHKYGSSFPVPCSGALILIRMVGQELLPDAD